MSKSWSPSAPAGREDGRASRANSARTPPKSRAAQEFRNDPDRHAGALLDAMLALDMGSERVCSLAVAVWLVGIEINQPRPVRKWIATEWAALKTKRGAKAATPDNKATTLRIKRRRVGSQDEARWRKAMAHAFMLVIGARDRDAVKLRVLQLAASVGEEEYARRVMLPMIDGKFPLPDFSTNFISMTTAF